MEALIEGRNIVLGKNIKFGKNVKIMHNCIIEDNVSLGDDVVIDSNSIVRSGTYIGDNTYIGSNCIIGEYLKGNCLVQNENPSLLKLGKNCIIRSGTIIYTDSEIGNNFQTGHRATIRELSKIGNNVSVGTLSDIQGHCKIGDYTRLHSNVHIGMGSQIDGFNWIYPYVCLTNDPTPPSEVELGVHICKFAVVATGSVILPGVKIGQDSLIGAGSIVTKDVDMYKVVVGNPAKVISDIRLIKNKKDNTPNYPWRLRFNRAMPWANEGFEQWFNKLDELKKQEFQVK